MERGEIVIVSIQFVALLAVVILLTSFSPTNSAQSYPVISSVYWGSSSQNIPLQNGALTKVTQNQSEITGYFHVAYSTQVSAIAATRLCFGSNSSSGESTTYTNIPWGFDSQKNSNYLTLSPTGQPSGWRCTYTIKVTDGLSQTTTWLGTVEVMP